MINNIIKMRELFEDLKVENSLAAMLFSGGLDTSILAALNPKVPTVTVCFQGLGEDKDFSRTVINLLNLTNHEIIVDSEEALNSIPEVINILKTFDPAIPNDLVVYFGLREIKKLGFTAVITGDASDELFGGYSYMQRMIDLSRYIRNIFNFMSFNSIPLAKYFGLEVIQPFLFNTISEYALNLPAEYKINRYNGQIHGKWILRRACENLLPENIAWQSKRPLEIGSGMTELREIIESLVNDNEYYEAKNELGIKFYNKEHYYYYKIYNNIFGNVPIPMDNEKKCPSCSGGMSISAHHCKTCGYVIEEVY